MSQADRLLAAFQRVGEEFKSVRQAIANLGTNEATPNTVVRRDIDGDAIFGYIGANMVGINQTPFEPFHAVRLDWVQNLVANALSKRVYRITWTGTAWSEPRPATSIVPAGFCEYVGPIVPTDWLPGDTYTETAV